MKALIKNHWKLIVGGIVFVLIGAFLVSYVLSNHKRQSVDAADTIEDNSCLESVIDISLSDDKEVPVKEESKHQENNSITELNQQESVIDNSSEESLEDSSSIDYKQEQSLEDSAIEEPVQQNSAAEEPVQQNSAAEEPVQQNSAAEEPVQQNSAAEESAQQNSVVEETVQENSSTEMESYVTVSFQYPEEQFEVNSYATLYLQLSYEENAYLPGGIDWNFTYSSDDSSIVECVSVPGDGAVEIKTKSPGTTVIRASSPRSNYSPASCIVHVVDGYGDENGDEQSEDNEEVFDGESSTIIAYEYVLDIFQEEITMQVGDEYYTGASISCWNDTPAPGYIETTWTSENPSCVTATSHGGTEVILSAISPGTTTIIVSYPSGPESHFTSDSCIVNVLPVKEVTDISLDRSEATLWKGETIILHASVLPEDAHDQSISWSSSNSSIATVSSEGDVTGISPGVAIITAVSSDGMHSASSTITVLQEALTVTASVGYSSIVTSTEVMNGISISAFASGGTENYIAYRMLVYYENNLIADVNDSEAFITPFQNGTYTVEVYVKDSDGNEASNTVSTTINISG